MHPDIRGRLVAKAVCDQRLEDGCADFSHIRWRIRPVFAKTAWLPRKARLDQLHLCGRQVAPDQIFPSLHKRYPDKF